MSKNIVIDMDIISEEENENIFSETHIKELSSSCDLLIRAHERIR